MLSSSRNPRPCLAQFQQSLATGSGSISGSMSRQGSGSSLSSIKSGSGSETTSQRRERIGRSRQKLAAKSSSNPSAAQVLQQLQIPDRSRGSYSSTSPERTRSQSENPFVKLIPDQEIAIVPSFTLESGVTLQHVPVAYSIRGKLNANGTNAMVICHALTGSADVADWWGPLLGSKGRAFDTSRFFIVCINSLGSPYGSASPVTAKNGDISQGRYGPEFPLTTIRDDVNIHKLILDDLGVKQVAAVIGGSMGGMLVLEWAYLGKDYVRTIIPIATSSRHSAWGISWGEAQRQSIYCDPKYDDGYYSFEEPPAAGLGAARMAALLTYRSRDSFQSRFGRNTPDPSRRQNINGSIQPTTPSDDHWAIHNDGHRNGLGRRTPSTSSIQGLDPASIQITDPQFHGATPLEALIEPSRGKSMAPTYFSAQSYLRYQGDKFVKRFDSNCYIAITRKLDTHDVSRGRVPVDDPDGIAKALALIEQPTLILGIESDGLFTFAEQEELAKGIPNSKLRKIDSPEGHDAFLLQFEQVNRHILEFFHEVLPDIVSGSATRGQNEEEETANGVGVITKSSVFGEAEIDDITAW